MNLIKHIANILFLLAIPAIVILFFNVLSGWSIDYSSIINSKGFTLIELLYGSMFVIPFYLIEIDKNTFKLFKTN